MSRPKPNDDSPDAEAMRAQLQRILTSTAFSNAPILSRFLRYVVEQKISATGTPLKEYTIGVEVFQRGTRFDPHVDTIVRVQARRLRQRLSRYYEHEGRGDPLLITVPKGHYQAEIRAQPPVTRTAAEEAGRIVWQTAEAAPSRNMFRGGIVPAPRTPLIGRATEVAQLCALLADKDGPRLVTLTGPAGCGKTRLAIEVGQRLEKPFHNDVVYLPLAAVTDAHTLQLELMHALGLRAVDNTPLIEILCSHLHGIGHMLTLILDNFEQLAKTAPLIGSLLDASISLKILTTSRVTLHLYGEWEYPVAPLALPERDSIALEDLAVVPAVELFVRRAASVRSGFSMNAANAEAVAKICRRFDGLPLGIEIAAAQCRTLTPMQLLERISVRLNATADHVMDVPERQRTLRHAIAWSYKLLAEPERKLFRRLSVFSGGCTLQAADSVTNLRGDLGLHVAPGVKRLLDNNLLRAQPEPGEMRYTMLETIREYSLEQLAESGENGDVADAHVTYYLKLAEAGADSSAGAAPDDWLARCDREQDNLRAALTDLISRRRGREALRLVCALYRYWEQRGYLAAAYRAISSVLERFGPATHPTLWSQVTCYAAVMEYQLGLPEAALGHCEHALAVARGCGDQATEIMALRRLAAFKSLAKDGAGSKPGGAPSFDQN